jgi:hypothetical protein
MADKADIAAANSGVGAMRTLFDVGALKAGLAAHLDDFGRAGHGCAVQGRPIQPDLSADHARRALCPAAQACRAVLKGAHDVLREARVQQALAGAMCRWRASCRARMRA